MFRLFADKNKLSLLEREPVTSGSVNVYEARFEFSEDWAGLEKTAVFRAGEKTASVLLDDSGETVVPWEVLAAPGKRLEAGAYGARGDVVVLPTVWADLGYIQTGAAPGDEARPPTPDLWKQELARKGDNIDYDGLNLRLRSGDEVLSSVEITGGGGGPGTQGPPGKSAYEIAVKNGFAGTEEEWLASLEGPPGVPGPPGGDGFSPTVTVTDIPGGHRVTITDADGPHTFDVMDGEDGSGGGADLGIPVLKDLTITNGVQSAELFPPDATYKRRFVWCENLTILINNTSSYRYQGPVWLNQHIYTDDPNYEGLYGALYIRELNQKEYAFVFDSSTTDKTFIAAVLQQGTYYENAIDKKIADAIAGGSSGGNPIGTIISFMGTMAPKDYLVCDGAEYSISQYPDLSAFFEEQFGTKNHFGGNGTTTFAVPDMRNLFLRGYHGEAEEQLSGEIGAKQEATKIPYIYVAAYGGGFFGGIHQNADANRPENMEANEYAPASAYSETGASKNSGTVPASYSPRPVNMAVLYCIKAAKN